jgi:protein-S-isoprenylcysteine O-methyltransferase Ste14
MSLAADRVQGLGRTEGGETMPKTVLPPAYFLASLVLMAALAFVWPIAPLVAWPWRASGVVPIAAGVWLNLAADRAFKERGTTVKPFERSSALMTDGAFRLTRNPMYLGMVLILIGVALLLGALTPILVAAGFAAIVETRFIPVEERMLAETFGDAWTAYRARTRRWI